MRDSEFVVANQTRRSQAMAIPGRILSGQPENPLNNVSDALPLQRLAPYQRQLVVQM
jgi:hypothetical protein